MLVVSKLMTLSVKASFICNIGQITCIKHTLSNPCKMVAACKDNNEMYILLDVLCAPYTCINT